MWVFNIKRALSVLFYLQSCTALTFLKTNLRLQNLYRHWDRIQGPNILGGPTYIHALHKVTDLWNCVMITYMTPLLWYWMLSMTHNDTCSKSSGESVQLLFKCSSRGKMKKDRSLLFHTWSTLTWGETQQMRVKEGPLDCCCSSPSSGCQQRLLCLSDWWWIKDTWCHLGHCQTMDTRVTGGCSRKQDFSCCFGQITETGSSVSSSVLLKSKCT